MPDLYGHLTPQGVLNGSLQTIVFANNYNDLVNKPSINSVELQGNKTAADLGLLTAGDIPVDSVNGKQGVVILDGDDIEYEAGTSVNSKITDLEAEIGSGPVISVNGKQGVVELDGTDINYSLTKTLNQKIDEVAASIPVVSYPVTSVNTKTGDVVLDGDDIDYAEGVTVKDQIGTNTADIGDLSSLTTSVKSSLVGAVNEVASYATDMTDTASGAIATFDTSLALPLQDCKIAINAVQEGSGTPSPDNVRPITGFTGANIHVADDENPHIIDNVTAISWQSEAGTVYGGSLDVTSGVLTVDRASVDLGTLNWSYTSGNHSRMYASMSGIKLISGSGDTTVPFICSQYVADSTNHIYDHVKDGTIGYHLSLGQIWVYDSRYSDATAFKTAMDGVQLVYELATPETYQLTPTQISAIVGTNNVFTDTNGDTSLEYYTKRGEQTVRIAEGVAVDVINNKNIDNLTTTNKTLVGAVNEVNSGKSVIANFTSQSGINNRNVAIGNAPKANLIIVNIIFEVTTTNQPSLSHKVTLSPAVTIKSANFVAMDETDIQYSNSAYIDANGFLHWNAGLRQGVWVVNGSITYE